MIADVFKGQWTDKLKILIEKHHGKMVPVIHNMTNYFQPLDLKVNGSCQLLHQNNAQIWYAELVQPQIFKGIAPERVSIDLKISLVKPIQTKWVNQYYVHIHTNKDIKNGWRRSGITKGTKENIGTEDPFEK